MKSKTKPYCSRCKSTDGRMHVHVRIMGRVYHYCRDCQTARHKKYRETESGMERVRAAVRNSIARHPERQAARLLLNYAVRRGRVVRPDRCSMCGEEKRVDGHHRDYSRPLEVQWLCRQCHADEGKKEKRRKKHATTTNA